MHILWVSGQRNLHFKQTSQMTDEWCATTLEINCCTIVTEKIASEQRYTLLYSREIFSKIVTKLDF